MNRWYLTIAPLALVLLQAACTQTPPPAPDTRAADEKAIRDNEAQWVKDYQSKDIDKVVAHYADDASVLLPGMPIMSGKDAIQGGLKEFLADPAFVLDFSPAKVEVSKGGDIAYSQGTYSLITTNPKTKRPVTEKGKYVTVYKKQADGSWKAVEDINNPDGPSAPVKANAAAKKGTKGRGKKSK